jgi:hypothetical protein
MAEETTKCVIIVDEDLPLGILANTAAVLGTTIGKHFPNLVGENVLDGSRKEHTGVVTVPIPVLKTSGAKLRELRERLFDENQDQMLVVDFSDVAQSCKTYEEYKKKISIVPEHGHRYFGLALCGDRKAVSRLTGSMPLLR